MRYRPSQLSTALAAGLLCLAFAGCRPRGVDPIDLRASFKRIEPYTEAASPPVVKEFSLPGPGKLQIRMTLSPWYRAGEPVRFRSGVPVDGRDEGAWTTHVPGVAPLSSVSTPERWVDGEPLTIVSDYRVPKARPNLQLGLFPSAVRFGDGSMLQLANSVAVTLTFTPEGAAAP